MTTTNKQLNVPAFNTPNWDVPLNENFEIIDKSLGGTINLSPTSPNTYTLTTDDLQYQQLNFGGTITANATVIIPDGVGGTWVVYNGPTGSDTYTLKMRTVSNGPGVTLLSGKQNIIVSDGVYCSDAVDSKLNVTGGQISGNLSLSGTFNIGSGKLTFDPSAGTPQLYVAGTVYATGNITAFSDERLKRNIHTIDNALELVKKMRGVRFEDPNGQKYVGVIAQEMQKVIPEVVVQHSESDYLAVAYQNLVGVLINAIQELSARIDELEKK